MTPKKKSDQQPADGAAPARTKRNKKTLTLTQKLTILNMMSRGEGSTAVARTLGLSEATVRSVKKNEDKIRRSVAAGAPKNAKLTYYTRDTALQKTEKILIDWIDEEARKGTTVIGTVIRKEAKRIYDLVKLEEVANNEVKPGDKPTTFVASKGWYEKFKKRYAAYCAMPDEPVYDYSELYANNEAEPDHDYDDGYHDDPEEDLLAPANPKSAKRFPTELSKIIEEKGYRPEQVYNADETGIYWKKMPKRTFLYEEDQYSQGYKVCKDRLSLVVCGNASGDFMVKPLIVHRVKNPIAFKGKNRNQLSVMWRSNSRARVTAEDFLEWFHNCFVHEVRAYLASKNLPFKVLLVLDTASAHPVTLQDEHANVKVVFLPTGTAPSLQPLDQGMMAALKANYTRRMFGHLVDHKRINYTYAGISECWWDYSLADFIKYFKEALNDVKPSAMNACWHSLWPQGVDEFGGYPNVRSEIEAIVDLAHCIGGNGFKDLLEMEVEELLDSHREELREEEFREFMEAAAGEDEENTCLETPKSQLSAECLEKGFRLAKELQSVLFSIDPFMERCFRMEKGVESALTPYKEMYRDIHSKRENKMKPTLKKKPKKRYKPPLKGPFPGFFDS